jgi:hypothetical protein
MPHPFNSFWAFLGANCPPHVNGARAYHLRLPPSVGKALTLIGIFALGFLSSLVQSMDWQPSASCIYTQAMLLNGTVPAFGQCNGPIDRLLARRAALALSPCGLDKLLFAVDGNPGKTMCGRCLPGTTFAEDGSCLFGQFCDDQGKCQFVTSQPTFGQLCPYNTVGHSSLGWCGSGLRCIGNVCRECSEGLTHSSLSIVCVNGSWLAYNITPGPYEATLGQLSSIPDVQSAAITVAVCAVLLVIIALILLAFRIYAFLFSRKGDSSVVASCMHCCCPDDDSATRSDLEEAGEDHRHQGEAPNISGRYPGVVEFQPSSYAPPHHYPVGGTKRSASASASIGYSSGQHSYPYPPPDLELRSTTNSHSERERSTSRNRSPRESHGHLPFAQPDQSQDGYEGDRSIPAYSVHRRQAFSGSSRPNSSTRSRSAGEADSSQSTQPRPQPSPRTNSSGAPNPSNASIRSSPGAHPQQLHPVAHRHPHHHTNPHGEGMPPLSPKPKRTVSDPEPVSYNQG